LSDVWLRALHSEVKQVLVRHTASQAVDPTTGGLRTGGAVTESLHIAQRHHHPAALHVHHTTVLRLHPRRQRGARRQVCANLRQCRATPVHNCARSSSELHAVSHTTHRPPLPPAARQVRSCCIACYYPGRCLPCDVTDRGAATAWGCSSAIWWWRRTSGPGCTLRCVSVTLRACWVTLRSPKQLCCGVNTLLGIGSDSRGR
jgi:hypothetical protein